MIVGAAVDSRYSVDLDGWVYQCAAGHRWMVRHTELKRAGSGTCPSCRWQAAAPEPEDRLLIPGGPE